MRTACALLNNQREAPHVLLRVTHDSREVLDDKSFPTWAPRWLECSDNGIHPIPLTYSQECRQNPSRASLGWPIFARSINAESNILTVTGVRIDTLTSVSLPLYLADPGLNINLPPKRCKVPIIEIFWKKLLEKGLRHPERPISELSLTMARVRPSSQNHVNDFLTYCQRLRELNRTKEPSPFPAPDLDQGMASNGQRVVTQCRDRRIGYTAYQRLALVPLVAKSEDECYIIQGMDVPVILRRTRNAHKLVGDAYVHGIMEGELMGPEFARKLDWKSIHLV